MRAKSIKGNSAAEIQSALQQNITADFKPTRAIVLLHPKLTAGVIVFEATTNGEFIDEKIY
jgi:hypothetical protein